MTSPWIQLVGGGVLLYFGAEWFVGGASSLALALRVPQILVGLTVVAYGTSAPEIIVGVQAAIDGHGEVALGNVVGSNIVNIGLILGVAVLIRPARVDGALRQRELPMFVASALLVPLLMLDGAVRRWEAVGLLFVAAAYTGWMIRAARSASMVAEAREDATVAERAADEAGAPKRGGALRAAATAGVGLGVLLLGGDIFVDGAVSVARALGMSDRLVGLTIVAVGTSLPELVTGVIAARRGHADIAIGNVVGSNIFNTFLCLGAAALAGPVRAPLGTLGLDLAGLLVMTGLGALYIRSERTISRLEGALAVGLYVAFTVVTLVRG
ncbi:calcium/sodium antiporter [Polyangium mundeleinium]|uniref:Calcium/sodium antiporter n=1 Tax=Polyangium mundeleinium TaxID=2995306 RepID=A0ABT5EZ75_9BACT|nr:calcium/sodium antiporter [Polyangium mundeleinium]MDC0746572.1 calcium/sodium antiporter [Polyangium mundeleinium]